MDPYKYFKFKQGQDDKLGTNEYLTIIAACEMIAKEEMVMEQNASRHLSKRRKKCLSQPREQRMYRDEIDGTIKYFGPRETAWYQNYVSNPPLHSKKFRSKFRRCFRCRYESFQKHLKEVQQSPMFKKWGGRCTGCCGQQVVSH